MTARTVPAAGSPWVAERIAGPRRRAVLARDGVDAARDRLLAVGHTSGAALALGISLALEGAG